MPLNDAPAVRLLNVRRACERAKRLNQPTNANMILAMIDGRAPKCM